MEPSAETGLESAQRAPLERPAVHAGRSIGVKEEVEPGALERAGSATGVARLGVVA